MARPTDYGPHIVEQAEAYLIQCDDTENPKLPTIEGLSLFLNVSRETMYAWERDADKPEFSDMMEKLRATQGDKLLQNGLTSKYNASMARLVLSKHGYVERQDLTTNGKDMPIPILGGISKQGDVQGNDGGS